MDASNDITGSVVILVLPELKSERLIIHHGNNMVDFNGSDDTADPLNWSPSYKWFLVILISLMSLIV